MRRVTGLESSSEDSDKEKDEHACKFRRLSDVNLAKISLCSKMLNRGLPCKKVARFQQISRYMRKNSDGRIYRQHRRRVIDAKPKVDTNPPKSIIKLCARRMNKQHLIPMELNYETSKKMTLVIAKQMVSPCNIDCWNFKSDEIFNKAREEREQLHKKYTSDITRANLVNLWKFSFVAANYCRFKQLKSWEKEYAREMLLKIQKQLMKVQNRAMFVHSWKDPYYTPEILYNKSIKRPTNSDKLRWIPFKDPHMIDYRGDRDWSEDEMLDVLNRVSKMSMTKCHNAAAENAYVTTATTAATAADATAADNYNYEEDYGEEYENDFVENYGDFEEDEIEYFDNKNESFE
ncbi:hypothetical protein HELRODRAFT_176813 [Helobdella robusta]|uniref:Uncharacterized protein n=1 Tax=Helobdella robusta TaxID=6412 RepID=T1FAX7_HELRO|nr:hypothetical protein HELRODRAFT_176813 [Helobdella robusta]ESN99642.1 hypothetical protein HELRODRAFT_176813 [Helobdella robusta]